MTDNILHRLTAPPVVAILRASSGTRLPQVCEVLYGEGIRAMEFTFTTPGALDALTETRRRLPGDALLGTGTVMSMQDIDASVRAGADFMVSPIIQADLLAHAQASGVPYIPGCVTPSEIQTAWAAGAPIVKVSPCGPIGGVAYIRAIRAPMPDVLLMPSGGIRIDETGAYLSAGATTIGLGGSFQGDAADSGGDLDALAARARHVIDQVPPR